MRIRSPIYARRNALERNETERFCGAKMQPYLENDRLPLDLRHILEDGIDDMKKLVPLQKTRVILLEEVNKVVQDEVRS